MGNPHHQSSNHNSITSARLDGVGNIHLCVDGAEFREWRVELVLNEISPGYTDHPIYGIIKTTQNHLWKLKISFALDLCILGVELFRRVFN